MTVVSPHPRPALEGRRIIITGAASGIGLATARRFSEEGARLALIDRNADQLAQVASELDAIALPCDVSQEDRIVEAVRLAHEGLGGIDGLVNCAGVGGQMRPLEQMTLEDWNFVMSVNLDAAFVLTRECVPHLRASERGTIVNIASGQGLRPVGHAGMAAYGTSKGALIAFSKTAAAELAPEIRVNAVAPGTIDTPILPDREQSLRNATGANSPYPLQRFGTPEEIASSILYLTSDESSYMTGTVMAVDGGRTFH